MHDSRHRCRLLRSLAHLSCPSVIVLTLNFHLKLKLINQESGNESGGWGQFSVTQNNKSTLISIDMTERSSTTKRVRLVTQIILIDDKINVDLSRQLRWASVLF